MQGVSTEKVAGGKLLRVKVGFDEKINSISIEGDFFAHPEDVVENIEKSLIGIGVGESENHITERISDAVSGNNAELVGIDAASIARNIIKAMVIQ